jgi:hypothetical protein
MIRPADENAGRFNFRAEREETMLGKALVFAGAALLFGRFAGSAIGADSFGNGPINLDRPGIADGSMVVGAGVFQVEIGLQGEHQSLEDGGTRLPFVPTLLRYGLDSRWEARIETNSLTRTRVSMPSIGSAGSSGYSPVSFGAKYHFQDATPKNRRVSLGAILRLFPASGSSDFRTHHLTGDLRLAADWRISSRWALNGNVGVASYEDDASRTFVAELAAMTLAYGPNHALQPWIDVGSQTPEERGGKTAVMTDGGVTYLVNGNSQIDAGVGTGIEGSSPPHPFRTAGYSRRF